MKLTPEIIEGFVNTCLRKNFDKPTETPECHREWWRMCTSPSKYVAIAAPRFHAKSTSITHAYVLASVLFRERSYVLIVSDTYSQSSLFLADIKRELLENEDIRELFEIGEIKKETEDDIIIEFNDGQQFRIQAKGAEQKLRGLKWNNKRPDLIMLDDAENDESVMNKDRRDKLKRWFYGALLPCLSRDGIVRIVGTILHLDSLLQSFMPDIVLGANRQKFLIKDELKEYTNEKVIWKSARYRAHNPDFTSLLWEATWSKEKLMALREDYIRQGLPDVYSQEMLNVPLDEARTFFRRIDFQGFTEKDQKKKLNYYISADLAISSKQRSDYTVFCIGGLDDEGVLHIKNVIRDRMDSVEICNTILQLNKLHKPQLFSLEDGQITKTLMPYLNEQMLRTGNFVPLKIVKPLTDKMARASSIQARMKAGGVKFDKNAEWYFAFEDELTKFPRDKHDDQVDAFAYLGIICDNMIDRATEKEEQEEEYEIMKREAQIDEGRSLHTGY